MRVLPLVRERVQVQAPLRVQQVLHQVRVPLHVWVQAPLREREQALPQALLQVLPQALLQARVGVRVRVRAACAARCRS